MEADSSPAGSLGEMAALGRLLDEHRARLLTMLQRRIDPRLRARVDPEEILNDVFFLARRRYADFQSRANMTPYAWLYRLALDCLIEAWRRQCARGVETDLPMPEESAVALGRGLIDPATSPSKALARDELRQGVQQCLDLLKREDRDILWMRHHDELTFAEAGAVLEVSANTAAQRYVRALGRMRKLWQQFFDDTGSDP